MADEIYGNDERIEALWAIKAMEHAEVYFNVSYEEVNLSNKYVKYKLLKIEEGCFFTYISPYLPNYFILSLQILCSVDPKEIKRLSQNDDEIYEKFRKDFPDLNVANLEEMKDLKSTEMKAKWREFCNEFKHVEDFSFATLIRLNSRYVHNCIG